MEKKTVAKRPMGRLKSMRVSDGFRDFVRDQLSGVPGVSDRSMFGGVGIYANGIFFAILAADILYFKVDDSNREEYEAAGSRPFKPYADRAMRMPYYAVPAEVVEDAATLVKWAKRSVVVASAAKGSKKSTSVKKKRVR